ncbi:MAG: permease [Lachnospiraceae bacterium]|nr:permease [Lachnospiraceae bacterium]
MFTKVLYGAAALWLAASFFKDRKKTRLALKKAWKSFENILPSILAVLLFIGMVLSALDEETISRLLGAESGIFGMAIAAAVGSISLIPGFVAFPLAASLQKAGAGYGQIAMFISTLMMVGIATLPLESKYFGRNTALRRNLGFFLLAVISSAVMGVVMR